MTIVAINAKNPEEIRVATFDKSKVSDLYIENTLKKPALKNIYAGIIRSIEPSLEAVFVEYGTERHGFLQFKDIAQAYFKNNSRQSVKGSLKVGQPIIIQVKKEEREEKGAALTTYITLPGTYLVLMPNHPGSGGVSKQITNETRKDMQNIVNQLQIPTNMSIILRTAAAGRSVEVLQRDLSLLLKQWEAIQSAFKTRKPPFLIFQEGDILARTIRDYAREDVKEIIVDEENAFEKTKDYVNIIRPDLVNIIRLYKEHIPLFLHLGIEDEVESAFHHAVRLPSGASIILNRTPAGVMIDVNSGSSTKHGGITETALKTNLEAAEMIARQLRLRDLGGFILIDFIGMKEDAHRKEVEAKLYESVAGDRARIQIGNIVPRFDALMMSRQRLRASLGRANEDVCLACQGQGMQRSVESLALSIIRTIEKKLFLKKVQQIRIEASVALITYLSNEKRIIIYSLEQAHQFRLLLLPNPHWGVSQYRMTSFSDEELNNQEKNQPSLSYELLADSSQTSEIPIIASTVEIPAVQRFSKRKQYTSWFSTLAWVKQVLLKMVPWGTQGTQNNTKDSSLDKQSLKENSRSQKALSNGKSKRSIRRFPKIGTRTENVAKAFSASSVEKKPVTQNTIPQDSEITLSKQISQEKALCDKAEVKADRREKVKPVKTIGLTRMPTLSSLKQPTIRHYGGEALLKKRGY